MSEGIFEDSQINGNERIEGERRTVNGMILRDCIDALIHAIHVVAESIALLLGMHFMLILHLVQLASNNSIETIRQANVNNNQNQNSTTIGAVRVNANNHNNIIPLRRRSNLINPRNDATLHLPALGPRPIYEQTGLESDGLLHKTFSSIEEQLSKCIDLLTNHIHVMADSIEEGGGRLGRFLTQIRRCETTLEQSSIDKLPPEIVSHILLFAAMPGSTKPVPTKIALLSKQHHRMITSRLYAHVHLSNPLEFRRFRMTMAVHNPSLGKYVKSLAIASTNFDSDGYLPEQVAEYVTLGIGIEQILLALPNLEHLYLDLFSLAALHNGTASRLEKGAIPISLTTEFSLPQYLTLPTFSHLKHVELTVFGLDTSAVEWFRQVLPCLQSLTIRWVTRRNRTEHNREDWENSDDSDLDDEEIMAWERGGRRHNDFKLFVEAIDLLRKWPHHSTSQANGFQLNAVSVLAWPKAYRELMRHYASADNVYTDEDDVCQNERMWNKSLPSGMRYDEEEERAEEQRRAHDNANQLSLHSTSSFDLNSALVNSTSPLSTPNPKLAPARLRIGKDQSYHLGPRRGPLTDWTSAEQDRAWPI